MLDEVFYLSFLIGHMAFGAYVIDKVPFDQRRYACSALGLLTSLLLTGWDILHQLLMVALVCVIVFVHRQKIAKFSLCAALNAAAFGYLLYFRFICENNFSNIIVMLLTLRLAGLGTELTDEAEDEKDAPLEDIFHYSFSYIGLLAGPYVRFRTYRDFMNGSCRTNFCTRQSHLVSRMRFLPIFIVMFLITQTLAPANAAKSEEFHDEHGFIYKYIYMFLMFMAFRARLYIGFLLAEGSCIAAGLGAYPVECLSKSTHGPKEKQVQCRVMTDENKIDFHTVYNVDIEGCEASATMRETMRSWNQSVQYWLAVCCYKRLPFNRQIKMAVTMAVSAFWHGLRPGYYFCFIGTALFVDAEDHIIRFLRARLPDLPAPTSMPLRIALAQIKMQAFAYTGLAFVMGTLSLLFQFYYNLYFSLHILVICIIVYCRFVAPQPPAKEKSR